MTTRRQQKNTKAAERFERKMEKLRQREKAGKGKGKGGEGKGKKEGKDD